MLKSVISPLCGLLHENCMKTSSILLRLDFNITHHPSWSSSRSSHSKRNRLRELMSSVRYNSPTRGMLWTCIIWVSVCRVDQNAHISDRNSGYLHLRSEVIRFLILFRILLYLWAHDAVAAVREQSCTLAPWEGGRRRARVMDKRMTNPQLPWRFLMLKSENYGHNSDQYRWLWLWAVHCLLHNTHARSKGEKDDMRWLMTS